MKQIRAIAAAIVLAFMPSMVWALGADHPADQPVGGSSAWPAGLRELVNRPQRVHGYFVNEVDVFFYSGDTDRLNAFLTQYSKLPGTKFEIVLHAGHCKVQSPWDEQPRSIVADWQLYTTPFTEEDLDDAIAKQQPVGRRPFVTRLDIWTGLQIDLDRLQIPAGLTVKAAPEAHAEKKIQAFAAKHGDEKPKQQP